MLVRRRPFIAIIAFVTAAMLTFALVASVLVTPPTPAAAQTRAALALAPARQAPAIGPWLGAPRGSISGVMATDGGVTLEASLVDADSARAVSYAVIVDGEVAQEGETGRPTGFGERISLAIDVAMADGLRDVCLQVGDRRFGMRTVDCVRATTAPPNTVSRRAERAATGVLVTPTGVVVPVTGGGAGAWQITTPCGEPATISEGTFVERARVVVDPGHGGSESGAHGGGIAEKALNLDVAESLVEQLEDLGISAQITRTADYRVPILTRAEIANALAPDVFISVHHNGGATRPSSRPGTEVFYTTAVPESKRLAAIMYEDMVETLSAFDASWVSTVSEGASLRLRDDRKDLYGIHRFSPELTSIITEFVYLSNSSEAALMQRPGMPELEATTIADALLRWWWTDDVGTTRGREFVDSSSTGTGGFDGCVDPALTNGRGLTAQRENLLSGHAAALTEPTPTVSLVPALQLAADPAMPDRR